MSAGMDTLARLVKLSRELALAMAAMAGRIPFLLLVAAMLSTR